MRILRRNCHLLHDRARLVLRTGVDYRGTNAAVTYVDYHTTRHVRGHSQTNKILNLLGGPALLKKSMYLACFKIHKLNI
jgi:hypothetical protein